jgi:flagellar motor switch protein FliN/FliY
VADAHPAVPQRGEVVVVEDRLGVTMTEIIKTEDTGA